MELKVELQCAAFMVAERDIDFYIARRRFTGVVVVCFGGS